MQVKYRGLIPLLLLLVACSPKSGTKVSPVKPMCLGIAYDVSESMEQGECPVLSLADVERMIVALKRRGGRMAFGLIKEKSFQPLTRLELQPLTGRLDERARVNEANKKRETEFLSQIESMLSRSRDAS